MNPDTRHHHRRRRRGAQTAALLRSKQVDALSQFDTQYALTENAGAKLRLLDTPRSRNSPPTASSRWRSTSRTTASEAVALARGYAKGTVFAIANPGGRDPHPVGGLSADQGDRQGRGDRAQGRPHHAGSARQELALRAGRRQALGRQRRGELPEPMSTGCWRRASSRTKTDANDLVTNDLLDDINKFDANAVIAEAKAYKAK